MSSTPRKEVLFLEQGPRHKSPIPQAVRAGGFLFLSAVRGVGPATDRVEDDDPEHQARRVFENLRTVLAGTGATLDDVVKVVVYMRDLQGDRPVFNRVWREHFGDAPPARLAVQVVDMGAAGEGDRFVLDVTALAP